MKLLTFVIPAYNSKSFLNKCLDSMLHPDVLEELEIIVVNDGSLDETPAIARQYCADYPETVRLINQENKGHGGALNTGCAAAAGKFLKVIDADDWVEKENLPAFLDLLRSCDSDVVLTHHYTVDITTGEIKKWMSYPARFGERLTFDRIMEDWSSYERSLTLHGITYNTAFYQRHGFRLTEHVFYEDYEYASFPCCYADSVTAFDLFIYHYRVGDVNQSVSQSNQLRRIGHMETVLRRMMAEGKELSCGPSGREFVAQKTRVLLLSYITVVLLVEPDREKGRKMAASMIKLVQTQMPRAWELAGKQYRVFQLMNRLGIRKTTWDRVLNSAAYRRIRRQRDFQ